MAVELKLPVATNALGLNVALPISEETSTDGAKSVAPPKAEFDPKAAKAS